MKKNKLIITGIAAVAAGGAVVSCMSADASVTVTQAPMKAVYNSPAKVWESEALPIGNGYMGAMIYGNPFFEIIQTNEHSLWSGGPGEDKDYDGGHLHTTRCSRLCARSCSAVPTRWTISNMRAQAMSTMP